MKKTVILSGQNIDYTLKKSTRARHLRMSFDSQQGLIVSVPRFMPAFFAERFIKEKAGWILKHYRRFQTIDKSKILKTSRIDYQKNKLKAYHYIKERVDFFNSLYKFDYKRISIRNQKSIWGSCTRNGNLQFNYKLTLLPQKILDYVVVHELCHLQQHNHSNHFWKLVSQCIPRFKQIRREMRAYIMIR